MTAGAHVGRPLHRGVVGAGKSDGGIYHGVARPVRQCVKRYAITRTMMSSAMSLE